MITQNENVFVTTFNGVTLPALDQTVYIVRQRMKTNVRGKRYTTRGCKDVELVEGKVTRITYENTIVKDHVTNEYRDEAIWYGEAAVTFAADSGVGMETCVFTRYTASMDKAEAETLLQFFASEGLASMYHGIVYIASGQSVTGEMVMAHCGDR